MVFCLFCLVLFSVVVVLGFLLVAVLLFVFKCPLDSISAWMLVICFISEAVSL